MSMALTTPRTALKSALVALALATTASAQAFFSDDEARKAILDLRQRVEQLRVQVDESRQLIDRLSTGDTEAQATQRRNVLELSNQIEQLRAELARLRGQNEQLARDLSEVQRTQKDVQAGVNERLRQFEPIKVEMDGQEFVVQPAEQKDFDAAVDIMRKADFAGAAQAFSGFLRRHTESGYTPMALYWLGNAHYAVRAYKEALDAHTKLVAQFPNHPRKPEAMLAMANSHAELKDNRAARRVLEQLIAAHPQSEAAVAARERLARLR
jgi:tol-pal system protein YbgF